MTSPSLLQLFSLISSTDVIRETLTLIFALIPNMIKLKDNATLISFNTS